MARGRPNILLIVTDQEQSRKTLPEGLRLPAHERLRASGVEFTEYHVNAIACSPARSTIYTGQHIQHTRVFDNAGPAAHLDPAATPTIGHMLAQQGYFTAYAGKWHLAGHDLAPGPEGDYRAALQPTGFDCYLPLAPAGDSYGGPAEGAKLDGPLARRVGRWLATEAAEIPGNRPWFMAVNLINPHDIMFFDATGSQNRSRVEDWADMAPAPAGYPYDEDLGLGLPATFGQSFAGRPAVHRAFDEHSAIAFGILPREDEAAWRAYRNYYFNCLRDVDRQVGAILDALDRCPDGGNTIVILTSDHGELAGAHGLRGKGPFVYRENYAVPMIVRHPDVRMARESGALFCSLDLAPTLLGLAGLGSERIASAYPFLKGYDMSEALASPGPGPRERAGAGILFNSSVVHANNPVTARAHAAALPDASGSKPAHRWPADYIDAGLRSFMRGCYDGRYRFARYFAPADHHVPADWETLAGRNELELYDTQDDPSEIRNLAQDPAAGRDLVLQLNRKLNALVAREVGGDDGSYLPGPAAQWQRPGSAAFDRARERT